MQIGNTQGLDGGTEGNQDDLNQDYNEQTGVTPYTNIHNGALNVPKPKERHAGSVSRNQTESLYPPPKGDKRS